MAFRFLRKKRTMRKRRAYKKRASRMATRRAPPRNMLSVKRKFFSTAWVWTTTTTNDFWRYFTFALTDIPNLGEYTSLFDAYRIRGLKYTFYPRYTDVEAAGAGATGAPTAYAHVIVDPDSTLIPSGVYGSGTANQLLENGRVRTIPLHKPFSIYYRPKVLMQALGGGTGGLIKAAPTIRTSDTLVSHRGFHMYVHQNNFSASANANIILDVFVTVYLTLKNVK